MGPWCWPCCLCLAFHVTSSSGKDRRHYRLALRGPGEFGLKLPHKGFGPFQACHLRLLRGLLAGFCPAPVVIG
jgi:hypothetical protein